MQVVKIGSTQSRNNDCYENLATAIIYTAYVDYMLGHWSFDDLERWAYSSAYMSLTTLEPKIFLDICKKAKENGLWHYQKTYII